MKIQLMQSTVVPALKVILENRILVGISVWVGVGASICVDTLGWKLPWMEEPGRLQSMGSRRVGHN